MSKAAEMAKVTFKGGFHMLWGLVISSLISSVGTVFIGNLLGDEKFGLYTTALVMPMLIANFRDWGINAAMIKYSAQYNAEEQAEKIRSIFAAGIVFETALGFAIMVLGFLLSGFTATLYNNPELIPLIQVASLTILSGALMAAAQAAFIGVERMELNSIALISQSVIKTIMVLTLVIYGLGPLGAVLGFSVASLVAGLVGLFLVWILYRNLPKVVGSLEIKKTIKTMFRYALPLSIATIIMSFQLQFYNFVLPAFAEKGVVGNYGIATSFVVLINFFAMPITTILFPAFSKLDAKKDSDTLKNVFQFSVKYSSLLVVPAAAVVLVLARPGIGVLFPDYATAPLFLALLSINHFLTAAGNLSIANLLNGQGQTKFNLKLVVLTALIGFPLSVILISQFLVVGLAIAMIVSGIPSLVIGLVWLKKNYGVTVDWSSSVRILFSAATASILTYILLETFVFSNWIALIIGAVVFFSSFIIAVLLSRAVNRMDLKNLRDMVGGLGPLRRPLNFILNIVEKLFDILRI